MLYVGACAGIGDLDRTQPGKLKKSALELSNSYRAKIESVGSECFFDETGPCAAVATAKWQLQSIIENIEVLRGYYDLFGYARF